MEVTQKWKSFYYFEDEVLPVLLSAANLISGNRKIEVQWKNFHSEIRALTEIKIDERTKASSYLNKEVFDLTSKENMDILPTERTHLLDQKITDLCSYFATMSALRHQLRKSIGDKKSKKDTTQQDGRYEGLEISEYTILDAIIFMQF